MSRISIGAAAPSASTPVVEVIQEELPGEWPAPRPGIWPDLHAIPIDLPVRTVQIFFAGNVNLVAGVPEDHAIADNILMGATLYLAAEVTVGKVGHRPESGNAIGTAAIRVTHVVRADRAGTFAMAEDNEHLRGTLHFLRDKAANWLAETFTAMGPEPEDDDEGVNSSARAIYFRKLARRDALKGAIDSTAWVPKPRPADSADDE